jgi:hypothetical protein
MPAGLVLAGGTACLHVHETGEQPAALGEVGGPGPDGQVLGQTSRPGGMG